MLYLLMIIVFLLSLWASYRVKNSFRKYSKIAAKYTGAEVARIILDKNGLNKVRIEKAQGFLTDHYDASANILRLSKGVFGKASLSAVGIAAHEAGHAIQKAEKYPFLTIRQALVPITTFSAWVFNILIFVGIFASLLFHMTGLIKLAILFLVVTVIFSLITLPVEFDASSRAKKLLTEYGIVNNKEKIAINKILSAAALTYVASSASAVITLLYMLVGFGSND